MAKVIGTYIVENHNESAEEAALEALQEHDSEITEKDLIDNSPIELIWGTEYYDAYVEFYNGYSYIFKVFITGEKP